MPELRKLEEEEDYHLTLYKFSREVVDIIVNSSGTLSGTLLWYNPSNHMGTMRH